MTLRLKTLVSHNMDDDDDVDDGDDNEEYYVL
jgi:hypothetical protein